MNRPSHRPGTFRVLRSDSGAFDLKSTVTASVLGAILAATLGAIVFGLIPWAWDNAAKSDLEAVKTAESAAISKDGRYFDGADLTDMGYLQDPKESVTVTTNDKGTCFAAVTESRTGKTFFIADWVDDAHEVTPAIRFVDGCAEQVVPAIMSWGSNNYGQLGTGDHANALKAVAVQLEPDEEIITVAGGYGHSCAATQWDIWCWGSNSSGQLGNGKRISSDEPVKVQGLPEGEVTSVSTGTSHTCAAVNGESWCWGQNYYGQAGTGKSYNAETVPVKTAGLPGTILNVTAGDRHTCAIAEGDVWCWGSNSYGQLGSPSTSSTNTPVKVGALTLTATASKVVAGGNHTCAIVSGDAWCWGAGTSGKLGNGQFTSQRSPVPVSALPSGSVTDLTVSATDGNHTCAIAGGDAWCWGDDGKGQLGDGTKGSAKALPEKVSGIPDGSTIDFISAGRQNTCASSGSTVWCWGVSESGQLGNGTTADSARPVKVQGLIGTEPITSLAAGNGHVLAAMGGAGLTPGETVDRPYAFPVSAFGSSSYGQLGTGGVASSSVAIPADWKPGSRVSSPTAGNLHSCALANNEAWCWGYGGSGNLGSGAGTTQMTPMKVKGLPEGTISAITAGGNHTCAIVSGSAWCWGYNYYGQLGNGTNASSFLPKRVAGLDNVASISAGGTHTCAVSNGKVFCWGNGEDHRLGTGSAANAYVPTAVYGIPLGKQVSAVSAGERSTCAIVGEASETWCWGYGPAGDGSSAARTSPVKALLPGKTSQISVGQRFTCAVAGATFDLYCWGDNSQGQLGVGDTAMKHTPVQVPGMTGVKSVTLGASHTCALTDTLSCWGTASSGQTGNGATIDSAVPVAVLGLPANQPVTGIAAGGSHTIAIIDGIPAPAMPAVKDEAADYPLKSWGSNTYSQLASGTTNSSLIPTAVDWLPGTPVSAVRSGSHHSCAVTGSEVWCWGWNAYGQLGDGTNTARRAPVKVTGLPDGQPESLQTAAQSTCVLIDSEAWCWGGGTYGLIGDGKTGHKYSPAKVQGLPGGVSSLALSGAHTCAVSEGAIYCWGAGANYRLGTGTTADSAVPVKVTGLPAGRTPAAVFSAPSSTCAVMGEAAELWCWGYQLTGLGNGYETTRSPAKVTGLTGVTAVAGGANSTCAIDANGTWCWGYGNSGQVGTGETSNAVAPVRVSSLENGTVLQLSSSGSAMCALKTDFSAWCWGENNQGQIGNGTTTNQLTPHRADISAPVTSIGAGGNHTIAVTNGTFTPEPIPAVRDSAVDSYPLNAWGEASHGKLANGSFLNATTPQVVDWQPGAAVSRVVSAANTTCSIAGSGVWCWGANNVGQLGTGGAGITESGKPVKIEGLPSGQPSSLQLGAGNACVVISAEAWCWGNNGYGQLGNGTLTSSAAPVKVSGLTKVTSVTVGNYYTCAVADGKAWCWGIGADYRLGSGSVANSSVPVEVAGFPLGKGVSGIAAGSSHTCAVVGEAAAVYCWGNNPQGLGNGATSSQTPVVVPGMEGATAIAASDRHTCAVAADTAWCWGYNNQGQLGDGSTTTRSTPVKVSGTGSVTDVALGENTSCILNTTSEAWCWGGNGYYQMGNGTGVTALLPVKITGLSNSQPVTSIAPGSRHTVAALGGVFTPNVLPKLVDKDLVMPVSGWGNNGSGQLGTGNKTSTTVPVPANWAPGKKVSQVIAGQSHSCALADGTPWCWGDGANYKLGDGTLTSSLEPVKVAGGWTGKVARLSLAGDNACALTDTGEVWCWGLNSSGQLGQGNTSAGVYKVPVLVPLPAAASMVTAGKNHVCAVADGDLYCWGQNNFAQSSPGEAGGYLLTPKKVTGFPLATPKVSAVAVGDSYTCAVIGEAAELYCWGYNGQGLGVGSTTSVWPVKTGLAGVSLVESGMTHVCAVAAGKTYCFGDGTNGKFGTGNTTSQPAPVLVPALAGKTITALSLSSTNTCALTDDGAAWCWGANASGQIGNGTTVTSYLPVQVSGLHSPGPVTSIAAGYYHTVAVIDGVFLPTAYPAVKDEPVDGYPLNAWGSNGSRQLGTTNALDTTSPTLVNWKPEAPASQVVAGAAHSCALVDGAPWCWGYGFNMQLGNGAAVTSASPVKVAGSWTGKVARLSTLANTTCAFTDSGEVWCWGLNSSGQLGQGNVTAGVYKVPVQVPLPAAASMVTTGANHVCAVVDGDLYCWGQNNFAQSSPGEAGGYLLTPKKVTGFPLATPKVSAVAVGDSHTCAVIGEAAELYCWGYNGHGLGVGSSTSVWPMKTGLAGVSLVESGTAHVCAVAAGKTYCFGEGGTGKLGDNTGSNQARPVLVPALAGKPITSMSLNAQNTCALTADGIAWCWGYNPNGQLGNGTKTTSYAPLQVSGLHTPGPVTSIAAGGNHTLAVIDGVFLPTAYPAVKDEPVDGYPLNAWGSNGSRQLGTTNALDTTSPTPVNWKPEAPASQVVAGSAHSCALVDGAPWCWGYGFNMQLGNGATVTSASPVKVAGGWTGKVARLSTLANTTCALTDSGEVWCWGINGYGQLGQGNANAGVYKVPVQVPLPAAASMVTTGANHVCAVADGDLYCWGFNNRGQSSPGEAGNTLTPKKVTGFPLATPKVSAVAVGDTYTCAVIGEAAELYCWGYNVSGLGVGSSTSVWPMKTGLAGVSLVESGTAHVCAVAAGKTYCFGEGGTGKLGDNTGSNQTRPVLVPALAGKTITSMSLNAQNTCALTADGIAWCWGYNPNGQLGNGTKTISYVPLQVSGLHAPGPVTSIAAGGNHTLAVIDGVFLPTAYPAVKDEPVDGYPLNAWGYNPQRQLGTVNGLDTTSPTPVNWKPEAPASQVVAGAAHSCALVDGAPWCWGLGTDQQLGNGAAVNSASPAKVAGGWTGKVARLSTLANTTCALTDSGEVWCWGINGYGQLGQGNANAGVYKVPVRVPLPAAASMVTAGTNHVCAVADGDLYCWGFNNRGQSSPGEAGNTLTPKKVTGFPLATPKVSAVAVGDTYTCAVIGEAAELYCWGYNVSGLGVGSSTSVWPMKTGLAGVSLVESGTAHVCAVAAGKTYCFGDGATGKLGTGNTNHQAKPVLVPALAGKTVTSMSLNGQNTCALIADGTAWCWGQNNYGQLGNGITTNSSVPLQVSGLNAPGPVTSIAAGYYHTLAVIDGEFLPTSYPAVKNASIDSYPLTVWGDNNYRQLASVNGSTPETPIPANWKPESEVTAVSAGANHSCAIAGGLYCWGYNGTGQVGDGTLVQAAAPVLIGDRYTSVSAGASSTCAVDKDGGVWCWGYNADGQLGDGTRTNRNVPTKVGSLGPAASVSFSENHACAALKDLTVWCWGANSTAGKLGNNSTAMSLTPVQAVGITGATKVTAGPTHTCALADGKAYCWGANSLGAVSGAGTASRLTPTLVAGLGGTITGISAGKDLSCAVTDGSIWCWGGGSYGTLGQPGSTGNSFAPVQVKGLPAGDPVTTVDMGEYTACAIMASGDVRCWGQDAGRLGYVGGPVTTSVPTRPSLPEGQKTRLLDIGGRHVLTVRAR